MGPRGTRRPRAARRATRGWSPGCRATPCRCGGERRAHGLSQGGAAAAAAPSSSPRRGASGRISGVRAVTLTDRLARGKSPAGSRSSTGRSGSPDCASTSVLSASSHRAAYPSASARVSVASPSRSTVLPIAGVPQAAQLADCLLGRLACDEAVRHVADTGGDRRSERHSSRLGVAGLHRHLERRRAVVNLPGEGSEVLGEIVERVARRRDVDEPEERRAELGVLGREPHRALVDRSQRVPCGRWKAVDELTTDRADLGLQPRLVNRLRGRVHALNLDLLGAGEGLAAQGPLLEGSATFEVGDQTIEVSAGTTCSARGTSRTATRLAPRAAGCCSSARPRGSRTSCSR